MKIVCDFDGTITINDSIDTLAGMSVVLEHERRYKNNEITFKKCISDIIGNIKGVSIKEAAKDVAIDTTFYTLYNVAQLHGIEFVVLSSNGTAFIKEIINTEIEIRANEFDYAPDGWTVITWNEKEDYLKQCSDFIIYIGDGISDIPCVKHCDKIFAKNTLLEHCVSNGIPVVLFNVLSDIIPYIEGLFIADFTNPELKLLSPGVVRCFEPATNSLSKHFTAMHRMDQFHSIYKMWNYHLLKLLDNPTGYTSIVVTGSATSAMDCVVSSVVCSNKTLFCSNGMFGERWADMGSFYNKGNTYRYKLEWGTPFDDDSILQVSLATGIQYVVFVHHDTSVGIANSLELVNKLGKLNIKTIVDCVSSFAIQEVSLRTYPMDIFVTNPNKGLGSVQGIGMIVMKDATLPSIDEKKCPLYMNLVKQFRCAKHNETTNTPCVTAIYASLETMRSLTYEKIIDTHKRTIELNEYIQRRINPNNLLRRQFRFPAILTCKLNDSNVFIDYCRMKGIVVYPGKGPLEDEYFQISLYGYDATKENIDKFIDLYLNWAQKFAGQETERV